MATRALTATPPGPPARRGALTAVSTFLYRRSTLQLLLLLAPPLLWFGVVYLGSLGALVWQSVYTFDDFSMTVSPDLTWANYVKLLEAANLDAVLRTLAMAGAVTVACAVLGFPVAYYMARYARGGWKGFLYVAVMLPMWASYIVKAYAWTVILAKGGVVYWVAERLGLSGALEALLAMPVLGGFSLSTSNVGRFLVFTYVWLPYMILPIQAALERVPRSLLDASGDLGARPAATLRHVTLPLAFPGVLAGSIFTFSLTLGDFVVPYSLGNSSFFIGQAVLSFTGTAFNIPLAAAFTVVPMAIMGLYLTGARKLGAFDAL
jgi:putative spermidine/putrescine transport system permease protein